MTYFDWIKSLPPEVMGEFLSKVTQEGCTICKNENCEGNENYDCSDGWTNWLQKEKVEFRKLKIEK